MGGFGLGGFCTHDHLLTYPPGGIERDPQEFPEYHFKKENALIVQAGRGEISISGSGRGVSYRRWSRSVSCPKEGNATFGVASRTIGQGGGDRENQTWRQATTYARGKGGSRVSNRTSALTNLNSAHDGKV